MSDKNKLKADSFDAIHKEALKRWKIAEDYEASFRRISEDDLKFVHGDSNNHYQWPTLITNERELSGRPYLTINKTKQHCNLIINDCKQNKVSIRIHPTGDKSTKEAADTFESLIRHIEYESNAASAYDKAIEDQVYIGLGIVKIETDYIDSDSFDQDIFIKRCPNPYAFYFDPNSKLADKSDMAFAFEFENITKEKFDRDYPDFKNDYASDNFDSNKDDWSNKDTIRIANYWRKIVEKDTLIVFDDELGQQIIIKQSDLDDLQKEYVKSLPKEAIKKREIKQEKVEWYKINGNRIIENGHWAGKYIPIIPFIGEEVVINGKMDRKGHVRSLKDPQRQYNYYTSSAVEAVALQTKTPYIGQADAFEGRNEWSNANTENRAYLAYNGRDINGNQIPRPERLAPAVMPEAFLKGLSISQQEMMMVSGQYQAQMGEQENAKSGRAIQERQRQGDRANYHFIDNQATAIRQVGRIILDLVPNIYDTARVKTILAENGTQTKINIDPNALQASNKIKDDINEKIVETIFNPKIGKYLIQSDVGPAFATKREDAANAITQIVQSSPSLLPVIGDLLFKSLDFPNSDDIAERLYNMIPPQALKKAPPPELQQAQQQLQHMQQVIQQLNQALKEKDIQIKDRALQNQTNMYRAETERARALSNMPPEVPLEQIQPALQKAQQDLLSSTLNDAQKINADWIATSHVQKQNEQQFANQQNSQQEF